MVILLCQGYSTLPDRYLGRLLFFIQSVALKIFNTITSHDRAVAWGFRLGGKNLVDYINFSPRNFTKFGPPPLQDMALHDSGFRN